MNFTGHVAGGALTGAIVASIAFYAGEKLGVPIPGDGMEKKIFIAMIFFTSIFFSVYPDLDRPSDMRSWFYRLLFVVLLVLVFRQEYQLVSLVAIIAIIPILGYEETSSHSAISVLLYPAFILVVYKAIPITDEFSTSWQIQKVIDLFVDHVWLWLACMLGWASHLILDQKNFLFIKNESGHY